MNGLYTVDAPSFQMRGLQTLDSPGEKGFAYLATPGGKGTHSASTPEVPRFSFAEGGRATLSSIESSQVRPSVSSADDGGDR